MSSGEVDPRVDDLQIDIDEDACLALTGSAEQCGNGTDTDASDPEEGFCGVHAGSDRPKVSDFDGPAWVGLRDELLEYVRSERDAYALATISPDIADVWEVVTALQAVEIGDVEFTSRHLLGRAREIGIHPDLDVDHHPLAYGSCIALQGPGAKNHSCPNSAYGASLLCGMHTDADLPGTILDEGEPGPDLDTVTVDGAEYQLVEQRDKDLIVVDPNERELHRLDGAAGAETRWNDPETTPTLSDEAETLVLVGCGDAKADEPRKAKNLYTSNYFGLKRRYAEEHGDEWAILSAKYGLLDPEAEIEPYDVTVDDVDVDEWGVAVAEDLPDVRDTDVVVLAGPDYAEEVEGTLFLYGADVETPTEGKKIGERMNWLSEQLDEDVDEDVDDQEDVEDESRMAEFDDLLSQITIGTEATVEWSSPNASGLQSRRGKVLRVGEIDDDYAPTGTPWIEVEEPERDDRNLIIWPAWDDVRGTYEDDNERALGDLQELEFHNDGQDDQEDEDGQRGVYAPEQVGDWYRAGGRVFNYGATADFDLYSTVQVRVDESNSQVVVNGPGPTDPVIIAEDVDGNDARDAVLEYVKTTTPADARTSIDTPETPGRDQQGDVGDGSEVRVDGSREQKQGSPEPPSSIPKYLREGLEKQSAEDLRTIAAYATELANHREEETERELEEAADQDVDETPDEWEDDEWEEELEGAREKAELPEGKGSLTTKTIDGRDYYYLQWREGDKIRSQYVAPVAPADSG